MCICKGIVRRDAQRESQSVVQVVGAAGLGLQVAQSARQAVGHAPLAALLSHHHGAAHLEQRAHPDHVEQRHDHAARAVRQDQHRVVRRRLGERQQQVVVALAQDIRVDRERPQLQVSRLVAARDEGARVRLRRLRRSPRLPRRRQVPRLAGQPAMQRAVHVQERGRHVHRSRHPDLRAQARARLHSLGHHWQRV